MSGWALAAFKANKVPAAARLPTEGVGLGRVALGDADGRETGRTSFLIPFRFETGGAEGRVVDLFGLDMPFRRATGEAEGRVVGLADFRILFRAGVGGAETLGIRFTGREDGRITGRGRGWILLAFARATWRFTIRC